MAKANTTYTPKPWEKQPNETPRAFSFFQVYRDLKPDDRSTAKVAEILGKSKSAMEQHCTRNGWVDRAAKWDDEQDRIKREADLKEQVKAIKKMRERHTKVAEKMIKKADEALEQIPADDIRPSDISKLIDIGTKLERISRGDVETVIEERQGETVSPVQFYLPDNGRSNTDDEDEE